VQQLEIKTMLVLDDELVEARLIVRCEQLHPSRRYRLMVELRHSEVRGVSLNAFSN